MLPKIQPHSSMENSRMSAQKSGWWPVMSAHRKNPANRMAAQPIPRKKPFCPDNLAQTTAAAAAIMQPTTKPTAFPVQTGSLPAAITAAARRSKTTPATPGTNGAKAQEDFP